MLTKVEVQNSQGALLTLQFVDDSGSITVQDIDGLDPVKAVLTSTSFANKDGEILQSVRRGPRNITIQLGLFPDPATTTMRALRNLVYSIFRPKTQIYLKAFVDDTDDSLEDGYYIVGTVESCESPMNVKEPNVSISIMCYDPDFIDQVPVTVTGMTTADTTPTHIDYEGTSETGFVATVNVNRSVSEITMYYTDANSNTWTMDFAYALLAGDVLTISTVPGDKYADLLRAGTTSSVLYGIPVQSAWPQFAPGDNWLRFSASGAGIPASVVYTKRFGAL